MVDNTENKAMVSRSLRLKESTLKVLEKEAKQMGLGITVHIRGILENHVATGELLVSLVGHSNDFQVREPLV